MSELQKSFIKSKLAKLPPEAPPMFDSSSMYTIDEASNDDDSSSASSAGTIMPSPSRQLFARPGQGPHDYSPLSWTNFFSQELFLTQENDQVRIVHHVYLTPPTNSGPLFVMHHGAGSSGLSFALCAGEIRKILPRAGILSLDARNHGSTSISRQDGGNVELDLWLETLSRDLLFIIRETQSKMGWESLPDIVLVGHSLGGAVITDVAKKGELGDKLLAFAVLDVVEGSAIEALNSMGTYLGSRPKKFPSLESGIEWHIRSRTIRERASAEVSVPSLLYKEENSSDPSKPWVWRTDLEATERFWKDWFKGLSEKFLESRGGKLLLLAGTDRLDKEMLIGQMLGKFQLQVITRAGHFIQEDEPKETAQILVDFYKRNDRSALVLPPKVGDMQAYAAMNKGTGASPGKPQVGGSTGSLKKL